MSRAGGTFLGYWLLALIVVASASICLRAAGQTSDSLSAASAADDKLRATNQQQPQAGAAPAQKLTTNNNQQQQNPHHATRALHRHDAELPRHQILDAPKLYHLNELLYKATDGNESPQSPALPAFTMGPGDGSAGRPIGALRPRAMAHDGAEADGDSSIEGLVRMMRGRGASSPRETEAIDDETGLKENGGGGGGARGASNTPARRGGESKGASGRRLKPDDEATIQRKSTNLDDDAAGFPETGQSASRIRARGE